MVHIVIVANVSILGEALEGFVADESDMKVYRFDPNDHEDIVGEILRVQPDVLIFEEGAMDGLPPASGPKLAESKRFLVIRIFPEEDTMHICERRSVPVSSLADIVSAIKAFNQ